MNHKIYKSEPVNGKYHHVTLLKGALNRDDVSDPCIVPDESFMILAAKRKDSFGGTDLYACRKAINDKWSSPINLGEKVNTEVKEGPPRISQDGKYLFFFRRDKWANAMSSNIL